MLVQNVTPYNKLSIQNNKNNATIINHNKYIFVKPHISTSNDCFIKSNNKTISPSFQGKLIPDEFIITYLKTKSYETSIKGSKRPYLTINDKLAKITKKIQIKINKDESINAFDINPKNSDRYLIFLHGFSQNITSNQALYESLTQTPFGILAIDYRGYGLNPHSKHISETDIMHDIQASAKYLKEKGINHIGLVGHSFGGYMAAKTSNINNFDFQILVSPMLSLEFWLNNVLKNPKKYKLESLLIKYIPRFKEQYPKTFEIDKHIIKNTTPTFVIHSKTDGYINTKRVNDFVNKIFNKKEYFLLPKGGHRMDENKINKITEILNKL